MLGFSRFASHAAAGVVVMARSGFAASGLVLHSWGGWHS